MGSEPNNKELWTVRLVIGIPMLVLLLYAFYLLSVPELIHTEGLHYVLYVAIIISAIILILVSRVTIPWTNVDETHVEYFIEELEEQEAVFVLPTACPHCKTPIELDKVWWEDKHTPLCQECQGKIKFRIIEK